MLRTGMIALQLLPSNCLAGIVVFTDGCTDVYGDLRSVMTSYYRWLIWYDSYIWLIWFSCEKTRDRIYGNPNYGEVAINDVLGQMRNQTISCSFVQGMTHSKLWRHRIMTHLVLANSTQHSSGLVPNQNLLKFISSATGGIYILLGT